MRGAMTGSKFAARLGRVLVVMTLLAVLLVGFVPTGVAAGLPPDVEGLGVFLELVAERAGVENDFEALRRAGVLTPEEAEFVMWKNCVTPALVWEVAWPLYGAYPYPAEFYGVDAGDVPGYRDGWAAAVAVGAADPERDKDFYMTPDEVRAVFAALDAGLVVPDAEIECPFVDVDAAWTRASAPGRNGLVLGWGLVPDVWRDDFLGTDWRFEFVLPEVFETEFGTWTASQADGLTDYGNRVIYVAAEDAFVVLHEMAHFVSNRMDWDERLAEVFEREASGTVDFIRDYGRSHRLEYVADAAADWLLWDDETRAEFREIAPMSAAMVEELVDYGATAMACLLAA